MQIPTIRPMEPVSREDVFPSDEWLYQVKWDGVRMLAYLDDGHVRLINRKGRERTDRYPEMVTALSRLPCRSALLDGEIIAMKGGRPDFFEVLKRDLASNRKNIDGLIQRVPVHYMVFDLLALKGATLLDQPLTDRQSLLEESVPQDPQGKIQLTDSFDDGPSLWKATQAKGLEGVVMKKRASVYHPGKKHPAWLKAKHFRNLTAVAVGVIPGPEGVHSLVLALADKEKGWRYIGRAGSGLSGEERQMLADWYPQISVKNPPVFNPPSDPGKEIYWIHPALAVEVRYLEWTPHATLRSPTILGFQRA
ncbi:non-homologous end-joining DNA ligase [Salinithrix halophila]|uniref:DNA ligase (ATP) n=1 Tax=Salinithrix halophila TaxID=1485204 RepID=A0ABV8JLJ0_9BACL